ncbi:hypothetical protein AJ79_02435 [Helicocarpus griseus UAMH5409]|uniref:Uncharacterized protein n=1 Tax=Helicocarpus griseus UAMH5409 TaxID=1447875 RepID=A0A2B7Y3Q6_9EURO|nr:hypothetical protein AJ79_02435 [Helicocarpus griseus UAMH5409]
MTTLLEYLTEPNPVIDNTHSLEGMPTKILSDEPIEVAEWSDFTYDVLMSCYECQIFDEDSLDHVLTRSVVPSVNEGLQRAWAQCYPYHARLIINMTRGGRASGSVNHPQGGNEDSKQSSDEAKRFPDWTGVQADTGTGVLLNCCPGDTKLSTKWFSTMNRTVAHFYWRLAQLINYCGKTWDTRYGYIISQEELVVLRISRALIGSGIAKRGSPRVTGGLPHSVPSEQYGSSPPFLASSSPDPLSLGIGAPEGQSRQYTMSTTSAPSATSIDRTSGRSRQDSIAERSITASVASLSVSEGSEYIVRGGHVPSSGHVSSSEHASSSESWRELGRDGEYRPIEMRNIPWDNSGPGELTVKLALWWLHMMAAAPGCDITIGAFYPDIDSWILWNGGYRHVSTGIDAKDLPAGANLAHAEREASPEQSASSSQPSMEEE